MKTRPNVAMTGATSSIAPALAAELCEDQKFGRIIFLDSEFPDIESTRIDFKPVDLADPKSDDRIHEILQTEEIDILVHCAFTEVPSRQPQLAHELETVGTMNLLSACARRKISKIILYSHTFLYGAHPDNPQLLLEHHGLRGDRTVQFQADKIEAERLVAGYAGRHAETTVSILRVCPLVGPTAENLTTRILSSLFVPVIAGFNPPLQLIHQQDAVRAFKMFCDTDYPGVFNITGRGYMPFLAAVRLMGNVPVPIPEPAFHLLAGSLYTFYLSSMPLQMGPFLKYSFLASGEKARRVAGYSATYSFTEVLEDFYRTMARRLFEK
jgi:UDP-glucose 4-epimerase